MRIRAGHRPGVPVILIPAVELGGIPVPRSPVAGIDSTEAEVGGALIILPRTGGGEVKGDGAVVRRPTGGTGHETARAQFVAVERPARAGAGKREVLAHHRGAKVILKTHVRRPGGGSAEQEQAEPQRRHRRAQSLCKIRFHLSVLLSERLKVKVIVPSPHLPSRPFNYGSCCGSPFSIAVHRLFC